MSPGHVTLLEHEVQRLLDERCEELSKPFALKVTESVQDGGWLYVVVEPDRTGVHSEDYVEIARWVEHELSESHPDSDVLIVPAKPQD